MELLRSRKSSSKLTLATSSCESISLVGGHKDDYLHFVLDCDMLGRFVLICDALRHGGDRANRCHTRLFHAFVTEADWPHL